MIGYRPEGPNSPESPRSLVMAIIEVRTRFTEDAKRKMALVSGTSDRVGAMREIVGEIGL